MNNRTADDILIELLVLRFQGGDAEACAELCRRFQGALLRHAYHLTGNYDAARDIVQDAWLAVVRGIGGLRDPACFRRWLYQIVTRRCADWVRGEARQRNLKETLAREARSPDATREDIGLVRDALQKLPGERQALLAMSYIDSMSIPEIAEALDVPAGTVKSRLYHARQELKELLQGRKP